MYFTIVKNLRAILQNEGATAYQIEDFRTLANVELKKASKEELREFDKSEQFAINFQKLADLRQDLKTSKDAKEDVKIFENYKAIAEEILKYKETPSTNEEVNNDSILSKYVLSFDDSFDLLKSLTSKIENFNKVYPTIVASQNGKYGTNDAYEGATTLAYETISILNMLLGGALQAENESTEKTATQ